MKGVPYQFVPPNVLKKSSRLILGLAKIAGAFYPSLELKLKRAEINLTAEQYMSYCIFNDLFLFMMSWGLFILFSPMAGEVKISIIWPFVVIFFICWFVFISQMMYPIILIEKNRKDIEKNLVAALKTIHVQLISGVSLFDSLVTLSTQDYGLISKKFKEVIKKINTGTKQEIALEQMASLNPSKLFRRSIWQVINGMKTGTELESVLKDVINTLSEEQVIQIQQYGSKLTPLTMFYMMLVVIVPTLSMVFLMVIGSLASLSSLGLKLIFWGVFILVGFVQYMFIGIINAKRPALLGEG